MENIQTTDCRDGEILTEANGTAETMTEWEKWPFVTDGGIISYLFICQ